MAEKGYQRGFMEITNISYFKKSHAPDVSIIVPKYPSQDVRNANVIESKDYVIHGMTLFLLLSESLYEQANDLSFTFWLALKV